MALLSGCLGGPQGPTGPVISPTGIVYEPGTPPTQTRFSQTATLYLSTNRPERALELALEGVEADPGNPIHHFLAGVARTRLGALEEADGHFVQAVGLYPAYELDVEPEREAAWAAAFNQGADAYGDGDPAGAAAAWRGAAAIFDLRPEAHRNLGMLLQLEGRYAEAAEIYEEALEGLERVPATRVLEEGERQAREVLREELEDELARLYLATNQHARAEPLLRAQLRRSPDDLQTLGDLGAALAGQGRREEAAEIYAVLLSQEGMEATQLFNLGIALFRTDDFPRAGEAFRRVTELRPTSRDAWFNYANALFAHQAWEELAGVGDRLLELDPLNESAALITARAHLERGTRRAPSAAWTASKTPRPRGRAPHGSRGRGDPIRGWMAGNQAEPGAPHRLRFAFYGDNGTPGGRDPDGGGAGHRGDGALRGGLRRVPGGVPVRAGAVTGPPSAPSPPEHLPLSGARRRGPVHPGPGARSPRPAAFPPPGVVGVGGSRPGPAPRRGRRPGGPPPIPPGASPGGPPPGPGRPDPRWRR
jgi:tetratricopeptide (TPR) repeat protein